jgi:hypothetical protein
MGKHPDEHLKIIEKEPKRGKNMNLTQETSFYGI